MGCWRRKVKPAKYGKLSQAMLKVVMACDTEGVQHWGCHHSLVQCVERQLRVGRSKMQMKYQDVPLEMRSLENYIAINLREVW